MRLQKVCDHVEAHYEDDVGQKSGDQGVTVFSTTELQVIRHQEPTRIVCIYAVAKGKYIYGRQHGKGRQDRSDEMLALVHHGQISTHSPGN